ncbi:MAG: MFS transporter, partial [Desulfobacterales bacterium]
MLQKSLAYISQFNRNLWVLSLGWFVSAMGFAVSIPFIAIYFHAKLGLSMTRIGLFFGAMAVIRSVFQFVGGEVSDRIERRYMLIYSQIIRAASFAIMAVAVYRHMGFWMIAASLMINSALGAVFQPAANAMVADILPPEKRLDGYALTRSAMNFGWAAGPALGGFMAGYSYGLLFLVSAALTLGSGLVFVFFLQAPAQALIADHFKFKDIRAIKDDPYLAWHSGLIFLIYLVHSQLIAPFSVYAVEMIKISEHQLGLLYTL